MSQFNINSVVVHPIVLLSVLDHYNRVGARQLKRRVVGVLLGEHERDGTLNVKMSYALPFEEREPNVFFLDHNFHEDMYRLMRKVNSNQKVLGWYSTGPKIRRCDMEISELFHEYCEHPALVIVNVDPSDELGSLTEAYVAVDTHEPEHPHTQVRKTFVHVPSDVGASDPEEVAVEHLLRDIRDRTVGTLSRRVDSRVRSLKTLHEKLDTIRKYVENVMEGKMPVNHKIMYELQNIVNMSPNLNVDKLQKAMTHEGNDQMLVVYLTSMVRAVLALDNLVSNQLDNKAKEQEWQLRQRQKALRRQLQRQKKSAPVPKDESGKSAEKKETGDYIPGKSQAG
ncbi:MAG: hypothetical protein MHM6MM_001825 [Cercozoa sp. M6MM]